MKKNAFICSQDWMKIYEVFLMEKALSRISSIFRQLAPSMQLTIPAPMLAFHQLVPAKWVLSFRQLVIQKTLTDTLSV